MKVWPEMGSETLDDNSIRSGTMPRSMPGFGKIAYPCKLTRVLGSFTSVEKERDEKGRRYDLKRTRI